MTTRSYSRGIPTSLWRNWNFPQALHSLEKAPRASEPKELARLYLRGRIECAMGRSPEAERDLPTAFARAPQEENYALGLGLLYIQYQKGLQEAQKARIRFRQLKQEETNRETEKIRDAFLQALGEEKSATSH
jgi:tetratricopeptide (TPR) repeat protein